MSSGPEPTHGLRVKNAGFVSCPLGEAIRRRINSPNEIPAPRASFSACRCSSGGKRIVVLCIFIFLPPYPQVFKGNQAHGRNGTGEMPPITPPSALRCIHYFRTRRAAESIRCMGLDTVTGSQLLPCRRRRFRSWMPSGCARAWLSLPPPTSWGASLTSCTLEAGITSQFAFLIKSPFV